MVFLSSHFISQFVLTGLYDSFVCLQLCSFAQFWLCIWLPDGGKSQFYWLVSLFLYLKFICNYNRSLPVALDSTFTLNDLIDLLAAFRVGLLFLMLTSYFVYSFNLYHILFSWSAFMILDHMEILDIHRICYLRSQRLILGRVHR